MAETTNESVSQESAEKTDSAKQDHKPRQTSAIVKFWIFIAVVLSLVSVCAAGYMAYRLEFQLVPQFSSAIDKIESVGSEISRLGADADTQKDQLGSELQKLTEEIDATGTALTRLEGTVKQSEAQVKQQVDGVKDSISALYQEEGNEANDWKVEEIIFLMIMAKHRVEIAGDVESALLVWKVAEEQLKRDSDPRLLDAKSAIQSEIAALEAVETVDLGSIANRLLSMANDVENLPLNLSPAVIGPLVENEDEDTEQLMEQDDSSYSAALSEVWNDIRSLVRVKKIDVSERSLLKPDMKIHLVQNLQLALMTAQSAAIRTDRQLYQGNLQYVGDTVSQHFSSDSPLVVDFSNQINELIETEISVSIPDLSNSIGLLRQALNAGVEE